MSEMVSAMATCGYCRSVWTQGGCTDPPTEDHYDLYRVQQLQLLQGRFIFSTFTVHGPSVERGQLITLNPSKGT